MLRGRDAELPDIQRQNRTEAPVNELQAEDDRHHQQKILEREKASKRDAPIVVVRPPRGAARTRCSS